MLSKANIFIYILFFHEEVKPHHKDRQCHFGKRKLSIFQGLWCDFFSRWKVPFFSHRLFNYCLKGLPETAETLQIFIHLRLRSIPIYSFISSLISFFLFCAPPHKIKLFYVFKGNIYRVNIIYNVTVL